MLSHFQGKHPGACFSLLGHTRRMRHLCEQFRNNTFEEIVLLINNSSSKMAELEIWRPRKLIQNPDEIPEKFHSFPADWRRKISRLLLILRLLDGTNNSAVDSFHGEKKSETSGKHLEC
jgi:hypothetical protein